MGQVFREDIAALEKVDATNVKLPASTVRVGGQAYSNSSDLNLDISASGAGGIDTGSVAANSTYFVYGILNAGVLDVVASLSDSAPTGFTGSRIVGGFTTNGSAEVDVVQVLATELLL